MHQTLAHAQHQPGLRSFLLFWACLSGFILFAQHHHFRNISIREGIPSSNIYRIFEDRKGYLWYLTDKGIARFDGKEWKSFSKDDGYHEVGAFHIAESKDGILWFVTTNFKLYYYKDQRFFRVKAAENIAWLNIDPEDRKWVITRLVNIFRVNDDLSLSPVINPEVGRGAYNAYTLIRPNDSSFIFSSNTGIYLVRNSNPKPLLLLKAETFADHIIARSFITRSGRIILSNHEGIYDYDPVTLRSRMLFHLKNNEVRNIYEDTATQDLWFSTFHGAYRFPSGIISPKSMHAYLVGNILSSVIKTKSGNFYFATMADGAYRCSFDALHINSRDGLWNENIAFIKKENGTIWLLASNGNIFYLDGQHVKEFKKVPLIGKLGSIKNAFSVYDTLVVIASDQFYALQKKKITPLLIPSHTLPAYGFSHKDPQIDPLLMMSLQKKEVMHVTHSLTSYLEARHCKLVGGNSIQNIGNKVYFELANGLAEIDIKGNVIKGFKIYPFDALVSDVRATRNGGIIVSTYNRGLIFIKGGTIAFWGLKEGMLSDYCNKITIRKDTIWACTNKGLSRMVMDAEDHIIKTDNFTSGNLLPDNEVNDLLIDNGLVYVATDKGISLFHQNISLPVIYPEVMIESVQVNNQDRVCTGSYTLPFDENNINIFYKSPGSGSTEPNLYKYTVSGAFTDTVYTDHPAIRYGSLLPGTYVFTIQARNVNSIWSRKPAVVTFEIKKPFWKQWWFPLLVSLCILSFIFYIVFNYITAFRRKTIFTRTLLESERKVLQLHMNPHFIFNTLNSLQKFILNYKPLEANKYISKFAKLLRKIMIYSDRHQITLQEELDFLDNYVELEQLRFDKVFLLFKEFDDKIIPAETYIPSLIIQPFIENAIRYGLTGLEGKGILSLKFEKRGNYLHTTIRDNGVGRKKVWDEQKQLNREYESTGIKVTLERLKLLTPHHEKVTLLEITDLYESEKATGTKVELMIPIL